MDFTPDVLVTTGKLEEIAFQWYHNIAGKGHIKGMFEIGEKYFSS